MFLYVSVMFGSLLSILCFMFCFMLCFCYVWQFALYFMFYGGVFFVMFPLCWSVCSRFLFYVLWCVLCYVSDIFCSLLSTLCFWSLCMFCFQYVSQFAFYLMCYVLFYVLLPLCFCLKSELCCVLVLCFCYVSVLCFSLFFLFCFCLKLVYVLFFYVSVMIVMLICFLLCFFLCFHSALQWFSVLYVLCWIRFVFFCVSVGFLLGFCLYVLWQHQICSSIWQSLEFAKSVGFWVGKSATSVPSLSRKNILDKYWPVSSSEYGPVRSFDHLSRDVLQFSAQQDCIGRRTAARHLAPPSVTRFENPWIPRKLFPPNGLIWRTDHKGVSTQSSQ